MNLVPSFTLVSPPPRTPPPARPPRAAAVVVAATEASDTVSILITTFVVFVSLFERTEVSKRSLVVVVLQCFLT